MTRSDTIQRVVQYWAPRVPFGLAASWKFPWDMIGGLRTATAALKSKLTLHKIKKLGKGLYTYTSLIKPS